MSCQAHNNEKRPLARFPYDERHRLPKDSYNGQYMLISGNQILYYFFYLYESD
jgi:hypothetical protein